VLGEQARGGAEHLLPVALGVGADRGLGVDDGERQRLRIDI
jgi:hypothetical protein